MTIVNLTPSQLRQAADLQEKIETLNHQLTQLLSAKSAPAPALVAHKQGRKQLSAAGLASIKAAQKARWAKINGNTESKPVKKARRKMSAEARAKIAEAAKARWAKVRAEAAKK